MPQGNANLSKADTVANSRVEQDMWGPDSPSSKDDFFFGSEPQGLVRNAWKIPNQSAGMSIRWNLSGTRLLCLTLVRQS
jgi:hypothetical protein